MNTPLAWKNVVHNKVRTAAALSGITFAILLLFMQLGFYDICYRSATMTYDQMDFDLALVSPQYVHLRCANVFPRRRLEQSKRVPGVATATPLYIRNGVYRNPHSRTEREMVVLGVDPTDHPFQEPGLRDSLLLLKKIDTAILDVKTSPGYDHVQPGTMTELEDRRIEVVGTYEHGAGFISDASAVVSDRTLARLFDGYPLELVSIGLVKLKPGADPAPVIAELERVLPADVQVRPRSRLEAGEQHFWLRVRPLGIMFSSGVLLALAVGAVILYQILAFEIMNKIKEYATLKAMGYSNYYLSKVVLQQATLFALMGFVPAMLMALAIYRMSEFITNLPMVMTWTRLLFVLVLSVAMCAGSGQLVSRKVARADPADLF